MGTTVDLLHAVEAAFVDGRNRPLEGIELSSARQFSELFRAAHTSQLPTEEWSFIESCVSRQDAALVAARRGRLAQARQGFEEIQGCLQTRRLSPVACLLIQALMHPAEAYLYYKLNDYDHARELLHQAAALDRILVTDFGCHLLSVHAVQIVHNLLRMHVRLNEQCEAVSLAAATLDYLELGVEALPDALVCPRVTLDSVSDDFLKHDFDRICGEVALLLAGDTEMRAAELFRPFAHHAERNRCLRADFGAQAHAWLYGTRLWLSGETDAFLAAATAPLRNGRVLVPALWFATILEVVAACRTLGLEGARLANWMAAEASRLADAPWILQRPSQTESASR